MIETGSYSNNQYLPAERRTCKFCDLGVEDEFHALLICPLYNDIREEIFSVIDACNLGFIGFSERDKFNC